MNKKIKFIPFNKTTEIGWIAPSPSTNAIPEWYKKMPQFLIGDSELKIVGDETNGTAKMCSPFLDAMSSGYTIYLSYDILVRWENGHPVITWKPEDSVVKSHSEKQIPGFPVPDGFYETPLKWINNFGISLPEGYSIWCTHPVNRYDLPFITITGFVDCDSFNVPVQFPFFIKKNWSGIIESGTPIAQLIPIKRENWISEKNNFNQNEVTSILSSFYKRIYRAYKTLHWHKKIYQ